MVGITFLFIMTVAIGSLLDCYIDGVNQKDYQGEEDRSNGEH